MTTGSAHAGEIVLACDGDISNLKSTLVRTSWDVRPIAVHLAQLSEEANRNWTQRLARLHPSCGCVSSAFFALGAVLALCFTDWPALQSLQWPSRAAAWTGMVLAASLTGKIAGIAGARLLLGAELATLRRTAARRNVRGE